MLATTPSTTVDIHICCDSAAVSASIPWVAAPGVSSIVLCMSDVIPM